MITSISFHMVILLFCFVIEKDNIAQRSDTSMKLSKATLATVTM